MRRFVLGILAVFVLPGAASPPSAATPLVVTISTDGHATNPVWYHDATATAVGAHLFMAWNTNHASVSIREWNTRTSGWSTGAVPLSVAALDCKCTDSTGTNPNRHDVPAVFTDPAGRVYALYGGGTASKMGSPSAGPYFRYAAAPKSIASWGPEQLLPIPGSAYDIETARDNLGMTHAIGQQGDNAKGAGSLVYLRMLPGTSSAPGAFAEPYRILVEGGEDPNACAWQAVPGCDVFVIGRVALGPSNPSNPSAPRALYLTWGWSEKNLSNSCGDPAGFCNRGLYFAVSFDQGVSWWNSEGTAVADLTAGPIAYDDPRYQVVDPSIDVGVFKAIAVVGPYPGVPWLVFQEGADQKAGVIDLARYQAPSWVVSTADATRAWNDHLVIRATSTHVYLWSDIAQSGTKSSLIAQWVTDPSAANWTASTIAVGSNWFLTGRAVGAGREVLMWRAPSTSTATTVDFTVLSVP